MTEESVLIASSLLGTFLTYARRYNNVAITFYRMIQDIPNISLS